MAEPAQSRRLLALAAMLPFPSADAQTADAMMANGRALTRPCPIEASDSIVVCGRADAHLRYRLPLPKERAVTPRPSSGNLTAAEIFTAPGDCGPSGTRRCTKREALSQGFGGGRDPLTLAARLAGSLVDPDR